MHSDEQLPMHADKLQVDFQDDDLPIIEFETTPDMFSDSDMLATSDAKVTFFLEPRDLRHIKYRSHSRDCRTGPPLRLYRVDDLRAAAIRKHGELGLKKKEEARSRRLTKKLKRKDASGIVLAADQHELDPSDSPTSATDEVDNAAIGVADDFEGQTAVLPSHDCAPAEVAVVPFDTRFLRASLLKLAKEAACLANQSSSKVWRVDVPCVKPDAFAAMSGRPANPAPKSSTSCSYSRQARACELFGCNEADLLQVFYRHGVGIQILDDVTLTYLPSTSALQLQGECEFVSDHRTMWI
jgi:hypothetical protein